MSVQRQLHLNAFIYPAGHHEAAWRHPRTQPHRIFDADYFQQIGRAAEAAKFDAVFFADGPALRTEAAYNAAGRLEPITLLTAIAQTTERIGLIATASTTYYEPYNLARLFSSLDFLSNGRAGWNIVTTATDAAAENFGLSAHPDPAVRYQRATEFVEAATRLWDSWEHDAIRLDREAGIYADTDRIHRADFVGEHLSVRGAFTAPRSPQGHPVLVQAGASDDGRAFASRYAEAIFTAHQSIENAQTFYADIKSRAQALGRNPDHVVILPGLSPFIGGTEAEAKNLEREFNELTVPDYGIQQLSSLAGIDLSAAELDAPIDPATFGDAGDVVNNKRSRRQVVAGIVARDRPTLRQLLHSLAGARGHRVFAGTPEQIADTITEWFSHGAADGFNVMPPYYPGGLTDFTETVVPILQRRGLFRTEYTGTTLRDHFGLPQPANQFATRRASAQYAS
ncbi:LLM class flavin-dependent oxidoreductase [Gordonia sp. ABSL1-1]|uniref:LLM class flavin-dependent oxidoreductase n=1 Tax=Gordonia sp. ABSL1-1 TaxID=3053923 RepID=UPI00257410C1|nr:LLM class flavin-dependent oxidoreductase [Gordonia sp. ABSL1-1]MDL9936695.1 LLM class flavin-dependent oxidoreductase [Gordonia sp. ABSL1-1]